MSKLDQRYARWRATPTADEILGQIHHEARAAAARGQRFGLKFFAELTRWKKAQRGEPTEKYKVNNSFVSRIARELAELDPGLKPYFETRQLKAERAKFPPEWLAKVRSPRPIPTVAQR